MSYNKIIVEGLWGHGKTSLINEIHKEFDYHILNEPNHIPSGKTEEKEIDLWYQKEYLSLAEYFLSSTKKIISERSLLDSGAFTYARDRIITPQLNALLADFINKIINKNVLVVYLYANKEFIFECSKHIADNNVSNLLKSDEFIEKYDDYFKRILPSHYEINFLYIDISDRNSFISKEKILEHFKKL
ncbi:MAG: hypothetical protein PHW52_03825 [Candidatus Pacebacteria bacterium]|nr:hypothetical protein [Candidatus Paceibacterota bacterium]